jgi:hypothetical protein
MGEQIARFEPGDVPAFANKQVLAGHFVSVIGAKTTQGDYPVEHSSAGDRPFGVSEQDSADPASDTQPAHSVELRVNVCRSGSIAFVFCKGKVSVLDEVEVAANGLAQKVDKALAVGRALTTATDGLIEVDLY